MFFLFAYKTLKIVLFVAYILMYIVFVNYYRLVMCFLTCLYYISAKIKITSKQRIFHSLQLNKINACLLPLPLKKLD